MESSGLSRTETADVASYHIATCPCDIRFPHSWKPEDDAPASPYLRTVSTYICTAASTSGLVS
ncbi:Uncharacterised protein [Mycobacteroides abscessus subsp. abscessus]|nr:Uncharacterised protein [Mycobacteroides abscessus subsp. abscessus]